MKWLRLYHATVNNHKVQTLPVELRWRWFECLCLAGDNEERGTLPRLEQVAFMMRIEPTDAAVAVDALIAKGLLDRDEDGVTIRIHQWDEHQPASDDAAARMRTLRASRKQQAGTDPKPTPKTKSTPATQPVPRSARVRTPATPAEAGGLRGQPEAIWTEDARHARMLHEATPSPIPTTQSALFGGNQDVPNMFGTRSGQIRLDLEEKRREETTPPLPPGGVCVGEESDLRTERPLNGVTTQAHPDTPVAPPSPPATTALPPAQGTPSLSGPIPAPGSGQPQTQPPAPVPTPLRVPDAAARACPQSPMDAYLAPVPREEPRPLPVEERTPEEAAAPARPLEPESVRTAAARRINEIFVNDTAAGSKASAAMAAGTPSAWILEAAEDMAMKGELKRGWRYLMGYLKRYARQGGSDQQLEPAPADGGGARATAKTPAKEPQQEWMRVYRATPERYAEYMEERRIAREEGARINAERRAKDPDGRARAELQRLCKEAAYAATPEGFEERKQMLLRQHREYMQRCREEEARKNREAGQERTQDAP